MLRLNHTTKLLLAMIQRVPFFKHDFFLYVFFKILIILAVVTLRTFYLGKLDLLTVYLGKLDFLSVTDFSLGSLPWGNFMVWVLDMSREQYSLP